MSEREPESSVFSFVEARDTGSPLSYENAHGDDAGVSQCLTTLKLQFAGPEKALIRKRTRCIDASWSAVHSPISGEHILTSKPTCAMALPRLKALFLALHLVAFGLARAIPLRRHSRAGGNPLFRRQSTWIPACAGMTTLIGPCIQTGRNGLLTLESHLKTFRTVPRKSTKNL